MLAVYLCAVVVLVIVGKSEHSIEVVERIVFPALALTSALSLVTYLTGETAHWNWSRVPSVQERERRAGEKRLRYWWIVSPVYVAIIVFCAWAYFNGAQYARVHLVVPRLAEYSACTQDSECTNVGDYCGYGCDVTVNSEYGTETRSMLEFMDRGDCSLMCPRSEESRCVAGMCQSVITVEE